jgi:molybdopterin-guanine dinucleotide biosynthesis protein A
MTSPGRVRAADSAAGPAADSAAGPAADSAAGRAAHPAGAWAQQETSARAGGDPPRRFDAVILAGGRARRLGGADKPGLVVGGRTLADAAISAAAGAAAIIVVGPEQPGRQQQPAEDIPGHPMARNPPLRFVREEPSGGGPVAALRRGIAEVSAPWLALLAADLPFLLPWHVHALLAAAGDAPAAPRQQAGAILADDGGRPQWLIGCWHTAALAGALLAYGGQSLHGLLSPLRPVRLTLDLSPGEPPPWLDCDSPADLRLARDVAQRPWRGHAGG